MYIKCEWKACEPKVAGDVQLPAEVNSRGLGSHFMASTIVHNAASRISGKVMIHIWVVDTEVPVYRLFAVSKN